MTPEQQELIDFAFAQYPDCPTLRIYTDALAGSMIYTVHAPEHQQRDGPALNFDLAYLQRLKANDDQRKANLAAAEEAQRYERMPHG